MKKKVILMISILIVSLFSVSINIVADDEYQPLAPFVFPSEKFVWNGTAWTHDYPDAPPGVNLSFKVVLGVMGNTTNYNITFRDVPYDALRTYIPNSGCITLFNGTTVYREPYIMSWNEATCSDIGHGSLIWNMTANESLVTDMVSMHYMTLYFNITPSNSNYSKNICWIYFCDFDHEYWDATIFSYTYYPAYAGDKFNTSIACNINTTETSDWVTSEHVNRDFFGNRCLDEDWTKYETYFSTWYTYNQTWDNEAVDWGWVLRYNNSNDTGGHISEDENNLSYVLANNSATNRSLEYMRLRYVVNMSEGVMGHEPFIGYIYSYTNNDNYDMVLYSYIYVSLLSKRNGSLVNTNDSSPVYNQTDVYNYYNGSWTCNSTYGYLILDPWNNGVWSKYTYNEYPGRLQVKAWDYDIWINEPSGWMIDTNFTSIRHINASCFGLVVWNPNNWNFTADFDFINEWKLNYTQNASHSLHNATFGLNKTAPLMYFKAINYTNYWSSASDWMWNTFMPFWFFGSKSVGQYADESFCYYRNLTRQFNMESKFSQPPNVDCGNTDLFDNQNDSVYYYSAVKTNVTFAPYKNELVLHIEDTTDGTEDDFDGALVAIDVDNDHVWGDNDMVFQWYWNVFSGATWYNIYNGTTLWKTGEVGSDPTVDAWFDIFYANNSLYWQMSYNSILPALHRYGTHPLYDCYIPLYYLEKGFKGSGVYLNENNTFGLHVMTIPFDMRIAHFEPDIGVVWENYNETTDEPLVTGLFPADMENEDTYTTWDTYMNISNTTELGNFWFDGLWNGVSNNEMQFWGHGKLGDETGYISETFWSSTLNKTCNVTMMPDITITNQQWYNISVFNDGENIIHNLTVNDTLPSGAVYLDCTLLPGAVTNPYDNCYIFNLTPELFVGAWFNLTIHVNITANASTNGSYIYNFVNVTNNESANASANCSFKYGTNILPTILWQYPANGNLTTPLLLANISVGVAEPEGTAMTITFSTSKTDTWASSWTDIGTNVSVGNGTYMSNQTFNNSQRYNTKWRWGNTVYWWAVSVTDLIGWTNATYFFVTSGSRYDIDTSGDVTVSDLTMTWNNRALDYLGIYDVDNSGDITVSDLTVIWAHH